MPPKPLLPTISPKKLCSRRIEPYSSTTITGERRKFSPNSPEKVLQRLNWSGGGKFCGKTLRIRMRLRRFVWRPFVQAKQGKQPKRLEDGREVNMIFAFAGPQPQSQSRTRNIEKHWSSTKKRFSFPSRSPPTNCCLRVLQRSPQTRPKGPKG